MPITFFKAIIDSDSSDIQKNGHLQHFMKAEQDKLNEKLLKSSEEKRRKKHLSK